MTFDWFQASNQAPADEPDVADSRADAVTESREAASERGAGKRKLRKACTILCPAVRFVGYDRLGR